MIAFPFENHPTKCKKETKAKVTLNMNFKNYTEINKIVTCREGNVRFQVSTVINIRFSFFSFHSLLCGF
jgi:hypothetical protein